MKIARYWSRVTIDTDKTGGSWPITLWRGSDRSEEDAREIATRDVERLRDRIGSAGEPPDSYDYPNRAQPEPIVDEILGDDGQRIAAVTINRQGCSVLNTARIVFVDVDLKFPKDRSSGLASRLFGRSNNAHNEHRRKCDALIEESASRLEAFVRRSSGSGARVYRTFGGLRYLLSAPQMNPAGDEAAKLFDECCADKKYAKLCRAQESFRARLSPKPWRMKFASPHPAIQYQTYNDDDRIMAWLSDYASCSTEFSVCELVREFGSAARGTDIEKVVQLHDAATGVGIDLPLA